MNRSKKINGIIRVALCGLLLASAWPAGAETKVRLWNSNQAAWGEGGLAAKRPAQTPRPLLRLGRPAAPAVSRFANFWASGIKRFAARPLSARLGLTALAAIPLLAVAGCGGGDENDPHMTFTFSIENTTRRETLELYTFDLFSGQRIFKGLLGPGQTTTWDYWLQNDNTINVSVEAIEYYSREILHAGQSSVGAGGSNNLRIFDATETAIEVHNNTSEAVVLSMDDDGVTKLYESIPPSQTRIYPVRGERNYLVRIQGWQSATIYYEAGHFFAAGQEPPYPFAVP